MKEKKERKEEKKKPEAKPEEKGKELVRIFSTDIPTNANIYAGLTRIKGISWSVSNAICNALKLEKKRKISSLTGEEIEKISGLIKNPIFPFFILNRPKEIEGETSKHAIGVDLEMKREFDIRRIKSIRCYRGWRHAIGQPVRGQRTRSHFRKRGATVGVLKKVAKIAAAKAIADKK